MPSISLTPRKPSPVDDEIRKYNDLVKEFTSTSISLDRQVSLVKQFLKIDHSKIPDCDFNIQTVDGWTPLMTVSQFSKSHFTEEDIKTLLDAGADVNLKNENGTTALMFAARNSRNDSTEETVKMLLGAGADVNLQTTFGTTALMFAARNSRTESTKETVKMLLDAGADVNLQRKYGWTSLMYAAQNSRTESTEETVKLLLDAGADVSIRNEDRETVFDLTKNTDTLSILREARKPKNTELSTITLDKWPEGTTFHIVLVQVSPSGKEDSSELVTITVEEGDGGEIGVSMTEDYV